MEHLEQHQPEQQKQNVKENPVHEPSEQDLYYRQTKETIATLERSQYGPQLKKIMVEWVDQNCSDPLQHEAIMDALKVNKEEVSIAQLAEVVGDVIATNHPEILDNLNLSTVSGKEQLLDGIFTTVLEWAHRRAEGDTENQQLIVNIADEMRSIRQSNK